MPKKSKKVFAVRIYAEFFLFYMLYHLLRLLPLRWGYALLNVLMRLLFIVDRRHARRSVQHILHSGMVSDHAAAVKLAKKSFVESGKLVVEIAKMDQLFKQEEFIANAPEETLNYAMAERNSDHFKGLIIVTAHYGNWEVAGGAVATLLGHQMTSLMRPFSNPLVGRMILNHRAAGNHILADKRLGVRPLLKALSRHEIATVLIDQHAVSSEGLECEFFGHPARVHMTPALLHLKTGAPIMPELTTRLPGNDFRFEMTAGELIRYTPTGDKEKDVAVVTQMCISALEKLIRQHPEQWMWAPRHWLDINRSSAEKYAGWRPKYKIEDGVPVAK